MAEDMIKPRKTIQWASVFLVVGLLNVGFGFAGESRVTELAKLSIEELIAIKVTSVLRTPQSLAESPAAVHVVTSEEIRRSGAADIPELLRTVPGVQVAEVDADIFAISIRGFNDIHANKLLVMVDGRSVYNHIFSGVLWNYMDVFMEDIDRIEVVRGPGSSVWGANAVNGVINIITKPADDTKGTFIEFGGGEPDAVSAGVRYGGDMGDDISFRLYAKGDKSSKDHLSMTGFESKSDLSSGMCGFRADWDSGKSDLVNLQGEVVHGTSDRVQDNPRFPEKTIDAIDYRAWHLLGRWRHTFSERSETTWQMYYQYEERVDEYTFNTIDLDFQHDYEFSVNHRVVWGLGYRFITDEMNQGLFGGYTFDPVERDQHLFSLFVQDAIRLTPDSLSLVLGSKFEHNDYTGFEMQPSVRLSWTPHERHALWGAVSRAVRTPSRLDSDATSLEQGQPPRPPGPEGPGPGPGPGFNQTTGSENFGSEDLFAYEIGYRTKPMDALWFDLAVFYNVYDDLFTYVERERGVWVITNDMEGETYGFEVSVDFRPAECWRLSGAWSLLAMDMRLKNDQAADLTSYVEETNPRSWFTLHSGLDLGEQVDFDVWLRHVDEVRHMRLPNALNPATRTTGDYTVFDVRLAWRPVENVELSITGRNLGGDHQEFTYYEVEESLFFKVKFETGNW